MLYKSGFTCISLLYPYFSFILVVSQTTQLCSLSSFTFIKRLFSSSSLSAIRVVSCAYPRLLVFLLAILIPACASSSPAFLMMYSAYKLNKQGDNISEAVDISPGSLDSGLWFIQPSILHSSWLQQYVDQEPPDVQARFRKGRGTRDQSAKIIEKAREFQKNICFIHYAKAFDCVDHNKLWKILQDLGISDHIICLMRHLWDWTWNNGLVPNWERRMSRLYIVTMLI